MNLVLRILLIAASYLAASFVAGCAALLGALFVMGEPLHIASSSDRGLLIVMIAVSSEFTAVSALLPAMPAIAYAERRGIRSFRFYTYAGALIGPVSCVIYANIGMLPELNEALRMLANSFAFPLLWLITAVSGFLGGLVYWLMAGRSVGIQRAHATLRAP
jgi:hypothetical protein